MEYYPAMSLTLLYIPSKLRDRGVIHHLLKHPLYIAVTVDFCEYEMLTFHFT